MAPFQGYRRNAHKRIMYNGRDVTNRLDPYLISVQVISKLEGTDQASVELDDRDAALDIPGDYGPLNVELGWDDQGPRLDLIPPIGGGGELPWEGGFREVFRGFIMSCESGFSRRGGGRRLWIDAQGADMRGKLKEPTQQSWGEGQKENGGEGSGEGVSLKSVFSEAMQKAGLQAQVAPSMANKQKDFWHMQESPMHFGQRIARDMGGLFKVSGNVATIVPKIGGQTASGGSVPTIDAEWGINLIAWRIKPFIARGQWSGAQSSFFKIAEGAWDSVKSSMSGGQGASGVAGLPSPAPNKQSGEQSNEGMAGDAKFGRGTGWCIINGEPRVFAGCYLMIKGARPGVDGRYLVSEAEHIYSRRGYTTRCNLSNPNIGASHGDALAT